MATFEQNKDFWMMLTDGHPAIEKQKNARKLLKEVMAERSQYDAIVHNLHMALESAATAAFYFNELHKCRHLKSEWKKNIKDAFEKCQRLVTMTRRYSGEECVQLIEERSSAFYSGIGYMGLVATEDVDLFIDTLAEVVVDVTAIKVISKRKLSHQNTVNTHEKNTQCDTVQMR